MKRTVALTVLGLTVVAASSVNGQGVVNFSNYASPYVPITYNGSNVGDGQGVTASVWGAAGNVGAESLAYIADATTLSQGGFDGYVTLGQIYTLPGYSAGQTWTLQLRASGNIGLDPVIGAGPLVVTQAIGDGGAVPPGTPVFNYTEGFAMTIVPEPTTFALAGLGAAALLIFRRRD